MDNHAGFDSEPGLYTATFVVTMNKDSYAQMPDDLKAIIDANSGAFAAALFGRVMDESDIRSRAVAEATDNTIVVLDDAEKALWMTAAETCCHRLDC